MRTYKNHRMEATPRKSDRLGVFVFLIVVAGCAMVVRLGYLQVVKGGYYEALASGQRSASVKIEPERGEILARDVQGINGEKTMPLATNQQLHVVYAVPAKVIDPKATADQVAKILELDAGAVLTRLQKTNDPYEPLKHLVSDEAVQEIQEKRIVGIESVREDNRLYPAGVFFAHVTGFLGYDGDQRKGQYGIEGKFDEVLRGQGGIRLLERDARGRVIPLGEGSFTPPKDGDDIVLTLDYTAQSHVCETFYAAAARYEAERGSVIIMNPFTGAVEVMCSYPTFDPNQYSKVGSAAPYTNTAVNIAYEPGSVFKAITMAAGLDAGVVSPSDTFTDEGSVMFGKYTIRNALQKKYGMQTMTQVLENSINTGAIHVMQAVGKQKFQQSVHTFGFGQLSGIELPSEAKGDVSSLEQDGEIYAATASFGQGITVTPFQLALAISAIANGGTLMRPMLIQEIRHADGTIEPRQPVAVRRVISVQTATTLSAMLVSVIKSGQGKRAGVPGYYVAGKTGTAQIARTDGAGYSESTNHTFVGFAPVNDPRFVAVVQFMKPQKGRFADSTASPTFAEIAEFLLKYYNVPPDYVVE